MLADLLNFGCLKGSLTVQDIQGTFSVWFDRSRPREEALILFKFFQSLLQLLSLS
jgi:hypothetical protein